MLLRYGFVIRAEQNQKLQEQEEEQREKQINSSWNNILAYETTTLGTKLYSTHE